MNRLNVPVGHIHMVLMDNAAQKLREKQDRYTYLPDPYTMLRELQEINQNGGIPALVNKGRNGTEQLVLYTSSYYLALYESSRRDGYTIGHLDSLNLREHERLSRGALRIQAQSWNLHRELREIPPGSRNFWDNIYAVWQHFERLRQRTSSEEKPEELSHAHEHYLAVLEDLLEVTRQLEQNKNSLNAGIPYKKVEAAGEIRDAPRDIYVFRLADFPQLDEKSMLRVKGEEDLRGRVLELEGLKLTLKFESLVDRRRIPKQGELEPIASPVIYNKQRQALEMLKAREARNTSLLRVLVDHAYLPYQPARILQESDDELKKLTPEQFEAFLRALTVPDMLMVLGPPGTGKTRTITEIARYCGIRKQRVLVTSGTHKAVDNVLERMPDDLIVIRVGHENNVSEKMRPKMIDAQAQTLQRVLLENTEMAAYGFGRLLSSKNEIDAMVLQLTQGQADLAHKEAHLNVLYQQRSIPEKRVLAPFKQKSDQLNANLQSLLKKNARFQKRLNTWSERRTTNETRSHLPVLGWLFMILLNYSISRIAHTQQVIQVKLNETRVVRKEITEHQKAIDRVLLADSEYQQYERQIRPLRDTHTSAWEELVKITKKLQATITITSIEAPPPELTPQEAATLQHYLSWFNETRGRFECRAQLMQEWRGELGKSTDQLYPELLRYADVVGATCIGTATAKGLEAVDFDLAIVDEAGQICLPDLLVPLVRTKRAVLVGDHNQLPPFVDSEVQNWLKDAPTQNQSLVEVIEDDDEIQLVTDILTKSAFEHLFTSRPDPSHLVCFTMQGRMPRTIADFASQHFYGNQLGTFSDDKMQHTVDADPLFRRELAVIDTSNAPADIKWEKPQRSLESLGETGYTNIAEARLIAELAELYQRRGKEWVVIVPYRAQARLVIQELEKRIEAHDFSLAERVATVDSFQGGERKKVIYGFTRSNERGKIGFLKELRRLNVAMTRAQQHLILIGNFAALTNADDPKFRSLLRDLYAYATQRGEILTYEVCRRRLRDVLEGRTVR